uniref:Uncharacterized protein n=1 Tax=Eutreptiella gymnastica TaxID=73025 RepID=A0A6T2D5I7_9EUGL
MLKGWAAENAARTRVHLQVWHAHTAPEAARQMKTDWKGGTRGRAGLDTPRPPKHLALRRGGHSPVASNPILLLCTRGPGMCGSFSRTLFHGCLPHCAVCNG